MAKGAKAKEAPPDAALLDNWKSLNAAIMTMTAEASLDALIAAEKAGRNRLAFLLRLQARRDRLRRVRERRELANQSGG